MAPSHSSDGPATGKSQLAMFLLIAPISMSSLSLLTYLSGTKDAAGQLNYAFSMSSVVFLVEVVKAIICIIAIYLGVSRGSIDRKSLKLDRPWRYAVPALIYACTNNLVFVCIRYCSPPQYKIFENIKVLVTAMLSKIMLGKLINRRKWVSLFFLMIGVIFAQASEQKGDSLIPKFSQLAGLLCMTVMVTGSSSSAVYTELVMKDADTSVSIHFQNLQLYFFGMIINGVILLYTQPALVFGGPSEFFKGYSAMTWLLVFNNSCNGLITSAIMKYGDNILRLFAMAASMLLVLFCSSVLFGFIPSFGLILGIVLVIFSIYLYNDGSLSFGWMPLWVQHFVDPPMMYGSVATIDPELEMTQPKSPKLK